MMAALSRLCASEKRCIAAGSLSCSALTVMRVASARAWVTPVRIACSDAAEARTVSTRFGTRLARRWNEAWTLAHLALASSSAVGIELTPQAATRISEATTANRRTRMSENLPIKPVDVGHPGPAMQLLTRRAVDC